jgi:hypothetical protein
MKMIEFEIYFDDLSEDAQKRYLKTFNTSEEEENFEISPLAIIEREDEEES